MVTRAAAGDEVMRVAREAARIVRRSVPSRDYRVYLFGSWASERANERSDIDIGIEGQAPVDPAVMGAIRDAFEALPTLYMLDIVDFTRVDPGFRALAMARAVELEGTE
jgi:predicted nucleotidyltransferase